MTPTLPGDTLSHKDAREPLLLAQANDQACNRGCLHRDVGQAPRRGPIDGLGSDLQSFGLNDLELMDQTGASWNRVAELLRAIDGLRRSS
jgi:hypothetical protein